MNKELLNKAKAGHNSQERLNLLREELHHLILQEMDRKGGFKKLCFLGGTALRMIYRLDRFSEDLDFSVSLVRLAPAKPDASAQRSQDKEASFSLEPLAKSVARSLQSFGIDCEMVKTRQVAAVHSCLFKFSNLLHEADPSFRKGQKLAIKFDVDTNPPEGARESVSPVSGDHLYKVRHYDLPSLFAGKLHAVLYRQYTKGRDLYDFLWYRSKKIAVNSALLENAIQQTQKETIRFTPQTLENRLAERFKRIDFKAARKDVDRFLEDTRSLSLFERETFLGAIKDFEFC